MSAKRAGAIAVALGTTLMVVIFGAFIVNHAVIAFRSGSWINALFGFALVAITAVGLWWIYREWSLAMTVQRMEREIYENGAAEDLSLERFGEDEPAEAIESEYQKRLEISEIDPADWRNWYVLAQLSELTQGRTAARTALGNAARAFKAR